MPTRRSTNRNARKSRSTPSANAVVSTDLSGNVTYLNAFAERMTGWRREEAVGRPLVRVVRIVDSATREASPNPMDLALRMNTTVGLTSNCVLIRRDGFETAIEDSAASIHDRQGRIAGAVMVLHNVSAARATSLHMFHLAAHDALTDQRPFPAAVLRALACAGDE